MNTCPLCQQQKPRIEFSTLTWWQLDLAHPVGDVCQACYWWQLVMVYPQHKIVDGRAQVEYIPYKRPHVEYVKEMQQLLPHRLKDEGLSKAFSPLGSLKAQAKPFYIFADGLVDEE